MDSEIYSDICSHCGYSVCRCEIFLPEEINKYYIEISDYNSHYNVQPKINIKKVESSYDIRRAKDFGCILFYDSEQIAKNSIQFEINERKVRILEKAKRECEKLDLIVEIYFKEKK